MSFQPVEQLGTPRRPGTISAAIYSLWVAAVLLLVYGAVFLSESAYGPARPPLLAPIFFLVPAVGFGALAIMVGRANATGRIVAYVAAGVVAVACFPAVAIGGTAFDDAPPWLNAT